MIGPESRASSNHSSEKVTVTGTSEITVQDFFDEFYVLRILRGECAVYEVDDNEHSLDLHLDDLEKLVAEGKALRVFKGKHFVNDLYNFERPDGTLFAKSATQKLIVVHFH